MKFLFIFPAGRGYHIVDKKIFPINPYTPPLGLLYLARILEDNSYPVEIIDYTAERFNENRLKQKIKSADAIGMTICTSSIPYSNELSEIIKKHDPDIPLIVGGPHCTIAPEQSLTDFNADISVAGEGELIINSIAKALEGKRKLSNIPGVYYKENGKIKKTKKAEPIKNLDKLPFPARHLVEKYEYGFILGEKLAREKTTAIITTRGCPHSCRFCGIRATRPKYHIRSTENVMKELDEIIDNGYRSIIFVDDNFLANSKRAKIIMEHIIQKDANLDLWIMGSRVDSADIELFEKMRDAGVKFISFGIESGNQDVLDYYNKKTNLSQIREAVWLSHKMGFLTSGSFILGAPIENRNHIENTIKFAMSLPLDVAHFLSLGYFCGSKMWNDAVKDGKISPEEFLVQADSQRQLSNFTEEELFKFCKKAHQSYYFDPRYIGRRIITSIIKRDFIIIKAGIRMLRIQDQ